MGDVADMMLDGTLCEGCGVFLNANAPGYPCYCGDCAGDRNKERKAATAVEHAAHLKRAKKCACPTCGKRVKEVGLADHMRDSHGVPTK